MEGGVQAAVPTLPGAYLEDVDDHVLLSLP